MSNKAFGNGYGEIEWITMSGALEQELKKREPGKEKLATWHWGKERYISYPETIEQIEHVQRLLKKHQVGLRENKKFFWLNTSPTELIDQVRKQRSEMSIADKYRGDLPRRLSFAPSEFQLAGSLYAFHTRRCIIADSYAEDRRAEALIATKNLKGYPVLIICREEDREIWKKDIKRCTTGVSIYDLQQSSSIPFKKGSDTVFLLTYSNLQGGSERIRGRDYYTMIVDRMDKMRNPSGKTFKKIMELIRIRQYRFLLTDQLISKSLRDFEVPMRLLGIWDELDNELRGFIRTSQKDPLDFNQSATIWLRRRALLRKTYHVLRIGYMVNRGRDSGLGPNEKFQTVICTQTLPNRYKKEEDKMSTPRYIGLCKVENVVAKIKAYLEAYPAQRTLIIAHHNDVVAFLKDAFATPAIYGKIHSVETRQEIANQALLKKQGIILILAQDIEPAWDIGSVDMIFFAEMRNTYYVQRRLKKHLKKSYPNHPFSVTYFMTYQENDVDANAKVRKNISKQMVREGENRL